MAAPDLERLLAELLEPDSDVIRRATARLREAFADPQTPARLGLLLSAAPRPQVRQLAAVLLRRRLLGGWKRLDPALRQRLPSLLAQALEQETEHAVTVALAQLGALVLRRGGLSAWGPLGTWVQEAARDPQPPRQEAALLVLSAALDAAPQALAPHGPPLAALCRGALAPGVPPGPMAYGLRALGGLAAMLGDTHTELLRSLLPDILTALKTLLDADEERGTEALEVLDEFVEADPAAVTPHLRPLLDFCLQVGGDESRGDAVRVRALATVTFLAQKRPKVLLRGGLLAPVLGGLLTPLCADPPPGRPDPEEEEEEGGGRRPGGAQPPTRRRPVSFRFPPSFLSFPSQFPFALDALAVGLPPEKLLQQLLPLLEAALGSPRAGARKGGLLALGALAGGCGEPLRRRYLEPALGVLRGGLGDPESSVRGAAAFALRSLADCLQPEVTAVAEAALPAALAALGGDPGVRPPPAKAWYILESLLECLGEGVGPWLPPVLETVLGALELSGPPRKVELGLSALHSLASTAGEQLQPHAGPILRALTPLLQPGPPETRPRRLQALGVLGALGRPVAGEGLVAALELGLGLAEEEDEPEGRRVMFVLAGAVAEVLGEGMGPLLPRVVPALLGALRRPPPPAASEVPDSFLLFDDEEEEEEEEGEEPMEEEEEEELIEVEVGGAYAQEVEDACEALGEVAEHSRAAFLPYLEPSLEAVLGLLQFPQAGVRRAAYETLGSLCLAMGGGPAPTPPDGVAPLLERALWALAGGARAEASPGGARGALGALGRVLEGPGPALPPALLAPIGRLLADVIKGKVACLEGGAGDDDDEEQAEVEAELRELAGEGLVALGGALGEAFAPLFTEILPHLLAALGRRRSVGERSWAAATLGEAGAALGGAVAPFLPRLGPALGAAATRDPHPEVRSNALFAMGRLAEAAGPALGAAWPGRAVLTQALKREGPGRVRDNACGALARHGGTLPPQLVVPLVLGALPLGQDLGEEPPVYQYLLGVHRRDPPRLREHAAELPRACGGVVGSGRLPPELEAGLVDLLRDVWGSCPTAFGGGLAQLPPGDAARLRRAMGLADTPGTC
ncbi:importin-4 [Haliaeetus albicilla]|uniref:importin-4 n=1 Tax=Haliaeetus albicilla TaxID=8969 RepID=UPI0037E8E58A